MLQLRRHSAAALLCPQAKLNATFSAAFYDEPGMFAAVSAGAVDFVSVTSSLLVCLEAQFSAEPILTILQPTSRFGGTFFALANRTDLVRAPICVVASRPAGQRSARANLPAALFGRQ